MPDSRYWRPPFAALGALALLAAWWTLIELEPVPVLSWANLGIHEFSHWALSGASPTTYFISGSVVQIVLPLLLAAVAFLKRGWFVGLFCLIWAAASTAEVAIYIADAEAQILPLVGGDIHDWHWLLSHWDALESCAEIAAVVRYGAAALYALVLILVLIALIRPPKLPALPGAGAADLLARRSDLHRGSDRDPDD